MASPHPDATARRPDDPSSRPAAPRRWLNLGVLAHVDAGKTSLTEALLHAGGALTEIGRVDDGTTQTDTLAQERRRGITIRSAVATFAVGDVTVNLVDTPGHPDFIAEVDRSLAVLDGAVLVLSAVEGVQAQTIVLHRALRRLGVPTVIMINKIDRVGADVDGVLVAVRRRLGAELVALGTARDQGTPDAAFVPRSWTEEVDTENLTAQLAEYDDTVLQQWVRRGRPLAPAQLWEVLGRLARDGTVHPVLFGSARTGTGVAELVHAVAGLLSVTPGDPTGAAGGQVFAVDRTSAGDRVCSVRLRRGTLTVRDQVHLGSGRVGTVTAIEAYEPGGPVRRRRAYAGEIVRVHGLSAARIGDRLGLDAAGQPEPSFPAPALQTSVVARDPEQWANLHRALSELADVDPLIRVRPDQQPGALLINVYGAVQQEVIADTLAEEYGVVVDFRATTVLCVERPAGRGSAIRRLGEPGHHDHCTLGVTVEPAAPGTGIELAVTADRLTLPMHVYGTVEGFRTAVLGYLAAPLATGLGGWPVTDVKVTVTDSGYPSGSPSAVEVRRTTAVVVAEALGRADTVVCEPVDRFLVETPDDTGSAVLSLLARHRAVLDPPRTDRGLTTLTGTVPTAEVAAVRVGLATAAHGEAVLESTLDHHTPVSPGAARLRRPAPRHQVARQERGQEPASADH